MASCAISSACSVVVAVRHIEASQRAYAIVSPGRKLAVNAPSRLSVSSVVGPRRGKAIFGCVAMATAVEEKLGIKIERNPSPERLKALGVFSWSKWGCPVSEFPWTYSGTETCYLLKGKVKVTPAGSKDYVEFGAGDLVVFPDGMSCTWDVSEAVDKHYRFD